MASICLSAEEDTTHPHVPSVGPHVLNRAHSRRAGGSLHDPWADAHTPLPKLAPLLFLVTSASTQRVLGLAASTPRHWAGALTGTD